MITGNTTLAKILEKKGAKEVLSENGVPCISCAMASEEASFLKIEQITQMYGLDKEKILKELNEIEEK